LQRQPVMTRREAPAFAQVTKAEKGLIWWLIHEPAPALAALAALEPVDFEGLAAREVLDLARKLDEDRGFSPSVLLERLSMGEAQLVTAVASESEPPVHDVGSCVPDIRQMRLERECAALQRSIEETLSAVGQRSHDAVDDLLKQKQHLLYQILELKLSKS
jgi:hypothetical protein